MERSSLEQTLEILIERHGPEAVLRCARELCTAAAARGLDRALQDKGRLTQALMDTGGESLQMGALLAATRDEAQRRGTEATGHPLSHGPKQHYQPKPGGCAFEEANLPPESIVVRDEPPPADSTYRQRASFYSASDCQGERALPPVVDPLEGHDETVNMPCTD